MYGITVHLALPASILSPSFIDYEQKVKPELCKKIEGPDEPLTPEQVATRMLKGLSSRSTKPISSLILFFFCRTREERILHHGRTHRNDASEQPGHRASQQRRDGHALGHRWDGPFPSSPPQFVCLSVYL